MARLAKSKSRNELIVNHYVKHRKKYGQTILFADRWEQCEYLEEALRKRGVRAGSIYSHIDADPGSAALRNARPRTENAEVLRQFKAGKLEVLLNIRMATEGTDVPSVQTVFLTRQTTSRILMTQMVGRALRGPKFGGTPEAYIVAFIDQWQQLIHWAGWDEALGGEQGEDDPAKRQRGPMRLLSVELVRRLARQMDTGVNVNAAAFLTFLPLGWYIVRYDARVSGSDDVIPRDEELLVYEDEGEGFERLLKAVRRADLTPFEDPAVELPAVRERVDGWIDKYFPSDTQRDTEELARTVFGIARHVAQSGETPTFFPFDSRDHHDLDVFAARVREANMPMLETEASLLQEFTRDDRFWRLIYGGFEQFLHATQGCIGRLRDASRHGRKPARHTFTTPETNPRIELTEEDKRRIKKRDGHRCLGCGYTRWRPLQVDHIAAVYVGGENHDYNLQTLCHICNTLKGTKRIDISQPDHDAHAAAGVACRT